MLSDYMHVSHNKLGTTKSCTQLLRNHQDMTGWMLKRLVAKSLLIRFPN